MNDIKLLWLVTIAAIVSYVGLLILDKKIQSLGKMSSDHIWYPIYAFVILATLSSYLLVR